MFRLYRSKGWSCVPALASKKQPFRAWKKYQSELPTDEEIDAWSKEADDRYGGKPQIGIVTGSISNLIVLDVDTPEGHQWLESTNVAMPLTPAVITSPGDGRDPHTMHVHYYFQHPGGEVTNKVKGAKGWNPPGMDLRGDGGFVVAPPSKHPRTQIRYEWMMGRGPEVEVAEMPEWLLHACGQRVIVQVSEVDLLPPERELSLNGVAQGERNATAARNVGRWFAMGLTEPEVLMMAQSWNLKNIPPLSDKELRKVVESIGRKDATSRAVRVGAGEATTEVAGEVKSKVILPWHEQRQAMIVGLSSRFGLQIKDIQKITGDSPIWIFTFADGKTAHLNTDQLFNNTQFRKKIFEQTGKVLKAISNKTGAWELVCQTISDAAEWVDSGGEATIAGELKRAIEDYLGAFKPEIWEVGSQRPPVNYPFCFDNVGFIFSGHLLNYLQNNKNMKINLRELAQRLTTMKFQNQRLRLGGFLLRVWGIPTPFMPPAAPTAAEGSDNVVPIKRF